MVENGVRSKIPPPQGLSVASVRAVMGVDGFIYSCNKCIGSELDLTDVIEDNLVNFLKSDLHIHKIIIAIPSIMTEVTDANMSLVVAVLWERCFSPNLASKDDTEKIPFSLISSFRKFSKS